MEPQAEAGVSKRRGRYSSRACSGCRRRRSKCDGAHPTCSSCERYGYECEWDEETDARRTISRQLLESLRAKIASLEAEVERLNAEKLTAQVAIPSSSQHFFHSFNKGNNYDSPSPPILQSNAITMEMSCTSPQSSDPSTAPIYQYIFQIGSADTAQNQSAYDELSLDCDWSRYLPELPGVLLSREDHDVLLLRGFKYGTSWLLGLVPENFLRDMLLYLTAEQHQPFSTLRLQHYTPLLHCSLLAFASAFSDNPDIKAPDTRVRFAIHAKQWLDSEFKHPEPCLVQALMLLAEYHCGIGEKEVGYMYMGMSIRATRSIWSKDYGHAQGGSHSNLLDGYRQIWSAFCHDKIMALGYGQEYDLPAIRPEIPLPPTDNELDRRPWPLEPTSTSVISAAPPRITMVTFQETCKLMVIASYVINVSTKYWRSKIIEEQVVIDTRLRLDTWFNNLPRQLLVWARSIFPLAHVITLHICYWWLLIVLHEPFYPKQQPTQQDPPRTPIIDSSIKMCDRASHKIVQLITMFDDQHGLQFFPRNMVEAIYASGNMLLLEYVSAPPTANKKRANAAEGARTCINALYAASSTWLSARTYANRLEQRLQDYSSLFPITHVSEPIQNMNLEDGSS